MTRKSADPVVSVVIITHNHRAYIEECLGSVLAQDLSLPWEVVVADDASSDGTAQLLVGLARAEDRLTVLTAPENLGVQPNLRRALSAARGQFVAMLEGDDFWTDISKLRRQVEYLQCHPLLDAIGHLTEIGGSKTGRYWDDFGGCEMLTSEDVIDGAFPHLSSLVFRRSRLPTTPCWFDGMKGADWLMCCLLSHPQGIGVIRRTMSVYRVNDDSSWSPTPFAERRVDHLRQLHALAVNTDLLSPGVCRTSFRRSYSVVFSSLARMPRGERRRRLASDALKIAPLGAMAALPFWTASQLSKRVRLIGVSSRSASGGTRE